MNLSFFVPLSVTLAFVTKEKYPRKKLGHWSMQSLFWNFYVHAMSILHIFVFHMLAIATQSINKLSLFLVIANAHKKLLFTNAVIVIARISFEFYYLS